MRFVDLASRFQSQITVRKKGQEADGKNPMEMMLLEATKGTVLELVADGPDAAPAVDALVSLVQSGFGET
jgi:phosphocarrier protein HPr